MATKLITRWDIAKAKVHKICILIYVQCNGSWFAMAVVFLQAR
jgi:hypothetical protein